jgi:hypothetical protein
MNRAIFLVLFTLFALVGCNMQGTSDESANKSEYSVLQAYEHRLRDVEHKEPVMVINRALDTDLTILAFPLKDNPRGYAVLLAKAEGPEKVKVMPAAPFVVTQAAYASAKSQASLSKEVDDFLAAKVK